MGVKPTTTRSTSSKSGAGTAAAPVRAPLKSGLLARPALRGLPVSKPGDASERRADLVAGIALSNRNGSRSEANALQPRRVLGGGRQLDESTRAFFEPRFGVSLQSVRIHDDREARQAALALDADAFTVGADVVLGHAADRRLLAHELAHVVQSGPLAIYRQAREGAAPAPAAPLHVGLGVPVHPRAVTGIHEWSSAYAAMSSANATNAFDVGEYVMQQISIFDENGNAQVYVYYTFNRNDKDDRWAVGPDSFWYFAMRYGGGQIKTRERNTDSPGKGEKTIDPRNLPAAPDAFREEPQIYYQAPTLPAYDEKSAKFAIGTHYVAEGYLRRSFGGKLSVLYYIVENRENEYRREWVVGPDSLKVFTEREVQFLNIAWLAYPREGEPPAYVVHSTRYVTGVIHGDPKRASEGVDAWLSAFKDPTWWFQVINAYASAAPKPTPVRTPNLTVVPKPGGPGFAPTVASSAAPTVENAAVAESTGFGAGGTATARATAPAPAVAPAPSVAPSPAVQPVTRPQGVPGWNPIPGPVAPRINPPPAWVIGALNAVLSNINILPGTAPQPQPSPQPQPQPKPKRPVTLWLPRAKEVHLPRYRAMLGNGQRVLYHSVRYNRGAPRQRDKWKEEMRPLTRDKSKGLMEKRTYDDGVSFLMAHGYAPDADEAREMMLVPNWSKHDKPPRATEVDHVIELQVLGPDWRLVRWSNTMGNFELLDQPANGSSGTTLDNNIAAERAAMAQYYGDPLWTDPNMGHDLVFDRVEVRGGLSASIRWTENEVIQGDHIAYLRKQGRHD